MTAAQADLVYKKWLITGPGTGTNPKAGDVLLVVVVKNNGSTVNVKVLPRRQRRCLAPGHQPGGRHRRLTEAGGIGTRLVQDADTGWQLRTDCRDENMAGSCDIDPDSRPSDANRAALAICESCPVRESCEDFALAMEGAWPRWGIWGGTLPRDRERITRARRRRAD